MQRKIINYVCADVLLTSLYSDKSAMDTQQSTNVQCDTHTRMENKGQRKSTGRRERQIENKLDREIGKPTTQIEKIDDRC